MSVLFLSCTETQDFGQYDDLRITPTYEASILYMEVPEDLINLASTSSNTITEDFNFDAFTETVFADRVIDGVVTYEIANTTSKELDVVVEFVDAGGNVLDTEAFSVDPAPTAILQREIAYGAAGRSIDIVTNTSSLRITATNLGDDTSTSSLPDPMVTLKSSGKFRVRIK